MLEYSNEVKRAFSLVSQIIGAVKLYVIRNTNVVTESISYYTSARTNIIVTIIILYGGRGTVIT